MALGSMKEEIIAESPCRPPEIGGPSGVRNNPSQSARVDRDPGLFAKLSRGRKAHDS